MKDKLAALIVEAKKRYSDIEDKQALFNETLGELDDFKDELMEATDGDDQRSHEIRNHWEWLNFANDLQQETTVEDDNTVEELDKLLMFLP